VTLFFILFIILVVLLALWGVSNLIAVAGGSPPVHTSLRTCYDILKLAKATDKDTVLDLGSGNGNMMVCATRYFHAKAIGYEISPFFFLQSKLRAIPNNSKIRIHFASIFEANLSDATIIFIYLLPKMLLTVFSKIQKEARPGTIIVTRGFPLPNWHPIKRLIVGREKTKIFIYKVK